MFRADAPSWQWEENVITSKEVNAWCMPGGKIAVYTGLIDRLQATDDEIAAVMGHEIAHALREHGRERASQAMAQGIGVAVVGTALGMGGGAQDLTQLVLDLTFNLPNSRVDETEADRIGVELAARAGFDPHAAVTLWQKMAQARRRPAAAVSLHAPVAREPDRRPEAATSAKVRPLYDAGARKTLIRCGIIQFFRMRATTAWAARFTTSSGTATWCTPRHDGTALLYIDRHLVHEVTSPQAFEGLKLAGRKPWRIDSVVATADHNTPTTGWDRGIEGIEDPISRLQVETLDANMREYRRQGLFPVPRQAPGHRARDRAGAGRDAAGHDGGLRRLAHQHARRLRLPRARHRHLRGRARARHAVPGARRR